MKNNLYKIFIAISIAIIFHLLGMQAKAQVPVNDLCAGATPLTSSTTCTNTAGNLKNALATTTVPTACGNVNSADVWYSFVAKTTQVTITLSSIGASFAVANPRIQLLSGTCGSLTSVACVSTLTLNATGLILGNTYYIRIHSANAGTTGTLASWAFNICLTNLPTVLDYSRAYINVTKGSTGGTVNYLDTLEIRSTFVVKANYVDSLVFLDTLYAGKGFALLPGTLSLRTNEGKIYVPYTDVYDVDAGHRYVSGADTVIRMNIGTGATTTARGRLLNTSKPSFYGGTCIVMATYRVVVYAGYGTKINFKTGGFIYQDGPSAIPSAIDFPNDSLIVYLSPGLCPNSVSITNAIGVESNGTFGLPAVPAPLARNRGTSPYTTYGYSPFYPGSGPQDYYYTVANNTSSAYTTLNTWLKPSPNEPISAKPYRLFGMWDIIGDHTGASNQLTGNPACDTTKPVSATNPCGYMLVVNSAYKTDTAFQYTMSNLCPNTYYELSAWIRNVCYKCGCDVNGIGAGGVAYIPSGAGDSSGVQPNIAFSVNGIDYYTTGNIPYYGTTQAGSDSTNRWVKKGFVYVTGPSETSFTLTIRNNAPGGGGNDWVMDDINVVTCLPNMAYSPSVNPTVCMGNAISITDTVRTFYSSYKEYKWQIKQGAGAWTDITGTTGTGVPVWNGSAYQYVTTYTVPPAFTALSNNGDQYRVVVATTPTNIVNANCNFTDGVAIITMNIINCAPLLDVKLLSFGGKLVANKTVLTWSTSTETEPVSFEVEKSNDGIGFYKIGSMQGTGKLANPVNKYNYYDSTLAANKTYYRIIMTGSGGKRSSSHIIQMQGDRTEFLINNLVNPFGDDIPVDVTVSNPGPVSISLLDAAGHTISKKDFNCHADINSLIFPISDTLAAGFYILRVEYCDKTITKKLIKK